MAVTASRTLAKVKSSAMRPRHPEVPNLIGELLMERYSRPRIVESRKLKVTTRNLQFREIPGSGASAGHWRRANGEEGWAKQNRAGNVWNVGGGKANCAYGGWQASRRVRQYYFEPCRVGLYVEGKA